MDLLSLWPALVTAAIAMLVVALVVAQEMRKSESEKIEKNE